ncbi:AsmA-like C-terminal region-containing protein [Microbaculum marinum]|uniref:AsmA-like C-terminal region-containing protein n=1 Tax=Microbaculum marinum TaxID=1764581 RepID=A0AAW9RIB0_9HYPH
MWMRVATGLGVLAVVVIVALGALVFRLSQGPLSVSFLTPRIVEAVQRQLPPEFTARISDTVIERDTETGDVLLRLRDISVTGPDGARVFAAPRAAIGLSAGGLFVGNFAPRSVWLIEPSIRLVDEGGRLHLEAGDPEEPYRDPDPGARRVNPVAAFAVLFALLDEPGEAGGRGLHSLGARDAKVRIDHADGTSGTVKNVDVGLYRGDAAGVVAFNAAIGREAGSPALEGELRRESGHFELNGEFANLSATDLTPLMPGATQIVVTGPISGSFRSNIAPDGQFDQLSADLAIGAGFFGMGDVRRLVDEVDIAFDWNYATGVVDIRPSRILVGNSRGTVSGQIAVPSRGDFSYGTLPLRLEFRDIVLDDPDTGVPASYDSATLEAFFVTKQKFLHISRLDLVGAGTAGSFVGFVGGEGESPGVKLAGTLTPTSVDSLKRVWPPFLADKARRWFVKNALDGDIVEGRVNVDIAPGDIAAAIRKVPLPRESFRIDFKIDDAVLRFLKQMPPVRDVDLEGSVDALEFLARPLGPARIDLPDNRSIDVTDARFFIPDIPAKPSTGIFDVDLQGSVSDILRLLDYPPVELAKRRNMDIEGFQGEGEVTFRLEMPLIEGLRFSDVTLSADGDIDNFGAEEFAGARQIEDGDIDVVVADGRVTIDGDALVEGVRADIFMEDSIDASGEPGARSMTMTLDEEARERLGMPLDSILSGPIVATVSDVKATADGTTQSIETDLTDATISFPALGLEKPAGESAKANFQLTQSGGATTLSELKVVSESMRVEGSAEFGKGGTLISLSLPVLRTPRGTDVSVSGRTESGVRSFTLEGKSLDLRDVLANASDVAEADSDADGAEMRIAIDVDKAIGVGGATLSGLQGAMTRVGNATRRVDVSAMTASSVPVTVRYSDDGDNADLSIKSSDAGGVLAWTGYYPHLRGGELQLTASRRGAAAPLAGSIDINHFRIAGDPSLARLIEDGEQKAAAAPSSRTSPSPGVPQRVNATDVGFDRLTADFEHDKQGMRVSNGVLRGLAVGATVEGTIDFESGRIALHGTYVPLYALNNLFGQLPLFLGPLLGGKKNEGLLGITYSLSGSTKSPVLTINPISVVAPGVFRYILGMDNPKAYTPGNRAPVLDPASPIR